LKMKMKKKCCENGLGVLCQHFGFLTCFPKKNAIKAQKKTQTRCVKLNHYS